MLLVIKYICITNSIITNSIALRTENLNTDLKSAHSQTLLKVRITIPHNGHQRLPTTRRGFPGNSITWRALKRQPMAHLFGHSQNELHSPCVRTLPISPQLVSPTSTPSRPRGRLLTHCCPCPHVLGATTKTLSPKRQRAINQMPDVLSTGP